MACTPLLSKQRVAPPAACTAGAGWVLAEVPQVPSQVPPATGRHASRLPALGSVLQKALGGVPSARYAPVYADLLPVPCKWPTVLVQEGRPACSPPPSQHPACCRERHGGRPRGPRSTRCAPATAARTSTSRRASCEPPGRLPHLRVHGRRGCQSALPLGLPPSTRSGLGVLGVSCRCRPAAGWMCQNRCPAIA